MKDSSDRFSLSDDDAYITSALWSDVKGKPRYVRVNINYRIPSSDREAAQNDVFSMGGNFEESRKVDSEAHDIELDAGGNIKKYEVKYYNGGRLVAKRDLLASYAWVAKPIQERGVKYHRRALDEGEKESVKIQ